MTNLNRAHLGKENLYKAYSRYANHSKIILKPQDKNDECLNDYWYEQIAKGSIIKFSLYKVLVFLCLILISINNFIMVR